jgi:hypothetical protein
VFSRPAKRLLSAHTKFYFFDAGVFRSLRPQSLLESASEIDVAALKGLKHFKEDYPEALLILLYRGEDSLLNGNILCLPVEKFLRALCQGQSLLPVIMGGKVCDS